MKSPKNVPHVIQMAFSQHQLSCRFRGTFSRRSQNARPSVSALKPPLSNYVGFIPIRWFLIIFSYLKLKILLCRVNSSSLIATRRCDRHSLHFIESESSRVETEWGAGLLVQSEWKGGGSRQFAALRLSRTSQNSSGLSHPSIAWIETPRRSAHTPVTARHKLYCGTRTRWVPRGSGKSHLAASGRSVRWLKWRICIWSKYQLWPISMPRHSTSQEIWFLKTKVTLRYESKFCSLLSGDIFFSPRSFRGNKSEIKGTKSKLVPVDSCNNCWKDNYSR